MALPVITLVLLGVGSATIGALGGLGGAILLVPALLLLGIEPLQAAPLGLLSVAAGSLAAAAPQLDQGLVHHRLGLTVELSASVGTVLGALAATQVPQEWLSRVLGVAALAGAIAALARRGVRNLAVGIFDDETRGEWPGTLGGQYPLADHMVPYQAKRLPAGLAASWIAGLIAGTSGVGGGFVKTPAMSELMGIPAKVAAATTTFTLGITSATGLIIFAIQGRLELRPGAAIVVGALAGGLLGAAAQSRIPAVAARRATGIFLVAVAIIVIGRTL
jgi:uncharacterized protein